MDSPFSLGDIQLCPALNRREDGVLNRKVGSAHFSITAYNLKLPRL
jgi:hypothetical protein